MKTETIIIIVVCSIVGLILLAVGWILFDKYYFGKKRCGRNLRTVERKYEYFHALLTGQDFQYVQRIEIISRTNLLYSDIYSTNFKRYKDIRDNEEIAYQDIVNRLNQLLQKSDVKNFKKVFKDASKIFLAYETAVNTFNIDLINVIKPEEEARQNSLTLKDKFRDVKSKYNSRESELSFVSDTFAKVFYLIDERFLNFENLIETADYDDANKILPEIDDVLKVCDGLIDKMPSLIKRTNEIIPESLNSTREKYNALIKKQLPLKHLSFEMISNNCDLALEEIRSNLKELKIGSCDNRLNEVDEEISKVNELFQKEEDSYEEFEANSERVYSGFNNLAQEFIKVRNNLNKYSKFYIVDEPHQQELIDIQKQLDDVSKDKRRLDMYVHSTAKSPYSTLVLRMRDLDEGTHTICDRFESYKKYLASLKIDTESAFSSINNLYFKLKETEETLREFHNQDFSDRFITDIDKSYKIIDDVSVLLKTIPINVNLVNENMNELKNKTDLIFSRVGDANHYRNLSEEEIMFMNRERIKFSNVNVQLSQAESLYLNGDYEQCYQMSEEVLKKINAKENLN